MRTIRIKVYTFDELNEKAKQTAIETHRFVNVDYNWWACTYGDAEENSGIRLTGFEIDGNLSATGEFIEGAMESAWLVTDNHREDTPTYEIAQSFLTARSEIVWRHSDGVHIDKVAEGNEADFDAEVDELETNYLKNMLKAYAKILQNESDYLQTDEAVIETIQANEWEFTEEGNDF